MLAHFPSAVLTGRDSEGYPLSLRCQPKVDLGRHVLRVSVLPTLPLEAGPAGLLCHEHDERLAHQRSFLVRGTLTREGEEWLFQPVEIIPGLGFGGPLGMLRFIRDARLAAYRYLAHRQLKRPRIPWDDINAVKARAKEKRLV
jgi:hypothetical protein